MYHNERKKKRKIIFLSIYLLLLSLVNVIASSTFMLSSDRLLFDNLWDFSKVNTAFAIPNELQIDNDTLTATSRVTNHPPVANVGINQIVNENSTVILVGAGSDPDLSDTISYVWRQISGPAVELINRTAGNPTFISPQVPSDTPLMFSLIVKDDKGAISSPVVVTVTVKHINHPPLANAGEKQSVQEGYAVSLDGSKSTDPDNEPIKYTWLQVSGPLVKLDDINNPMPTFTAPSNITVDADLTFRLTVEDYKNASDTDDVIVTVKYIPLPDKPPVANAGKDQVVEAGAIVSLDGNKSEDPEGKLLKYSWVQTTGTPSVTLNDNAKATATFTAPDVSSDAIYTFKLGVTDEVGAVSYDDVKVTVKNTAPISNPNIEPLNLIYRTTFIPEALRLANLKSFTHSITVWIDSTVPVLSKIKNVTYFTKEGFTTLTGGQTESFSPADKFRISFNALDGFPLDAKVYFSDGHLQNLSTKIVLR